MSATRTQNSEYLLMYMNDVHIELWGDNDPVIHLMYWGWECIESTKLDRCPNPGIRTIYAGKHSWEFVAFFLCLCFYIPQCPGAKKKGLWKENKFLNHKEHIKGWGKVKIKIAASKADKTQNQYKACLISKNRHFDQSQVNLSK